MALNRLERLSKNLPDGTHCGIVVSSVNRRYLTGFKSSAGVLAVFKDGARLFVDSRYFEKASREVSDCPVTLREDIFKQLSALFRERGVSSAAVESESMTLSEFSEIKEKLPGIRLFGDGRFQAELKRLRMIKTSDELCKIEKAQEITDKAFSYILGFIHSGVTEREVALKLEFFMRENGAESIAFDTIAVSGSNSSLPHGTPGDRRLENGDFLTLDFGAVVDGYHSDMTRTVAIGHVSQEMKDVYDAVYKAQAEALSALKAGTGFSEADGVARSIIGEAGYDGCFGHGLGHGVGLEIHEAPSLSPKAAGSLRAGMVVTVEPGIYIPGKFGVRIEDMVAVSDDGVMNFTKSSKELICL